MEKKEKINKAKIGTIAGIAVFVVLILTFVAVLKFNDNKSDNVKISSVEQEKIESFASAMEKTYEKMEDMEYSEAKDYLVDSIYENADSYGGNDSVDYLSNALLTETLSDASNSTKELIEKIKNTANNLVDELKNGLMGDDDSVSSKDITIKSNTVCNDGDIDSKYCVSKLNAKIYITDVNSDKWAVVLHGHNMTGSLMYKTVGSMYAAQGYNVLAPDLRGAGSSDGSVAMGYLESLDVYDWIKDLNSNYSDASRYGVKVAPKTIIVHGVSLGGATTLQLATNPDIAAAAGAPYTKNLTQLNVKGFVDDCGYTSMNGIITGLLGLDDSASLTSLFSAYGIDKAEFMTEFTEIAKSLNITGFEEFDINSLSGATSEQINQYFNQFTEKFEELEEEFKKYEESNGEYQIPGYDKSTIDDIYDKYGNYFQSGNYSTGNYSTGNYSIGDYSTGDYSQIFTPNIDLTSVYTTNDSSTLLNTIVSKVLIKIGNVGLDENNYEKYSNVFSTGRKFPSGAKVVIIHGTADTIVPHSNADTVANNVSPATLLHKWDATGNPHAFIVVGKNKTEYTNLVTNFTKCINDTSCTSIDK